MSQKPFYITTTLPYVNAPLHLGHATEIIRADAIARAKKLQGFDVFFNTGTDEHGKKILESAQKAGVEVKEYVDEYARLYKETLEKFGVLKEGEGIHFIRTTDEKHIAFAKDFWNKCLQNGFIYKKNYKTKYCVGCEEEKTDSELVEGLCPEHRKAPEIIEEENYFFKFSGFGERLLKFYDGNPDFIIPNSRMNEMREFIKRGLHDFSISRLKSKMPWGIEVPGDGGHVMYVWFDALTDYLSTLDDEEGIEKYWNSGTPTQYCGKDNTRFQGVMWQAMLMAAGYQNTKQIVVNGFILGDGGVKMSKSLGNTIDPLELVAEYGTDALRYFVLREFHPFEDTAVSKEKLKESYNANLANGIGNLTSRIMKMAETNLTGPVTSFKDVYPNFDYEKEVDSFNLQGALNILWAYVASIDNLIQTEQPFKVIKTDYEKGKKLISDFVRMLFVVAEKLQPFLPETSDKIKNLIKENKAPEKPLFLRKD